MATNYYGNNYSTSSIWQNLFPSGMGDPVTKGYYDQNPQAGYNAYLGANNLMGNTSVGQYARSRYSSYYNDYQGVAPYMKDGANGFLDYLGQNNINPVQDYATQGASDRGESPFLYAPRARMMLPS